MASSLNAKQLRELCGFSVGLELLDAPVDRIAGVLPLFFAQHRRWACKERRSVGSNRLHRNQQNSPSQLRRRLAIRAAKFLFHWPACFAEVRSPSKWFENEGTIREQVNFSLFLFITLHSWAFLVTPL